MNHVFQGWEAVAISLQQDIAQQRQLAEQGKPARLNAGQCDSLDAIAMRLAKHGVIVADEVGMGKTRIAVSLIRAVTACGGRVAILVPPVLGFQWQDELKDGGLSSPPILRSLWQYMEAWRGDDPAGHLPWFEQTLVLLTHTFANWRLGKDSARWRWALLPDLYAWWRKKTADSKRLPRGYYAGLAGEVTENVARSICQAIPDRPGHPLYQLMEQLQQQTPWPGALDASNYMRDERLRPCLEQAVGLGMGCFDLIVIDEAHKSRHDGSSLSGLLQKIIQASPQARRFAMTATPVELDAGQWQSILARIGLAEDRLQQIRGQVESYAIAVQQLRQSPSDAASRSRFRLAAGSFQQALAPFVLRRDKREDDSVRRFRLIQGNPHADYRQQSDIAIEVEQLTPAWRQAVCAAEALSLLTRGASGAEMERLKRLRLTMGNGHGLAAVLDAPNICEVEDQALLQELADETGIGSKTVADGQTGKREQRAQWWNTMMQQPFAGIDGDTALFNHPAILAAVTAIEDVMARGDKVLVFGRYTRPLARLTDLLNARAMLRHLEQGKPWPQLKVHGNADAGAEHSLWPAVRAAHAQLASPLALNEIDSLLGQQYRLLQNQRRTRRRKLLETLGHGFSRTQSQGSYWQRAAMLYQAFCRSIVVQQQESDGDDEHVQALLSRALDELLGEALPVDSPLRYAEAFAELINALCERNEGDSDGNGELDADEADRLWPVLEERLRSEYRGGSGGVANLMYGGTETRRRRMMQLAFNRPHSAARVLIAQSLVGREGLNLHQACRTVVLLHPEWNPGVVEQQIGRVDRVGSYWQRSLERDIASGVAAQDLPRIEIRPVIFKGTYDEYNWQVLRQRWDMLRAQLHGHVLPAHSGDDPDWQRIVDEIAAAAPSFSPTRTAWGESPARGDA